MERIQTFDVMKGIGIVAMVLGHCISNKYLVQFIYIWHMPLFFILSGYFFKPDSTINAVRKSFKSILIPYIVACITIILFAYVEKFLIGFQQIGIFVNGALFGTPMALWKSNNLFAKGYIFALWFLPALFSCRIMYNSFFRLSTTRNMLMGGVLCFSSVLITKQIGHLPLGILQAMYAIIFFQIGNTIKRYHLFERFNTPVHITIAVILFSLSIIYGKIGMASCTIKNPLISIPGAVSAVMLMYMLLSRIPQTGTRFLAHLGRISILILCLHTFDGLLGISSLVNFGIAKYLNVSHSLTRPILMLIFAVVGSICLSRFSYVRKAMNIKSIPN